MRYRDLVFVLCLVAVAAVWWSTPQEPPPTLAESEVLASPVVTASPDADKLEEAPLKLDSSEFSAPITPKLELRLKSRGQSLEDIVLQATLTTEVDALIPMVEGQPLTTVTTDHVGYLLNWRLRSKKEPQNRELKKGETLSWELRMASFERLEEGLEEAEKDKEWAPPEPLILRATIVEGGSIEPSTFMRSPFVTMSAELTIPPHEE